MAIAKCVFPRPGLPARISERPSVTKSADERRAEHLEAQRRLIGEIEIVDRLEKGKVRAARQSREARLLPMGDLLGGEQREEIAIGPALALGALDQIAPDASRIREMQPFEERVEIGVGGDHDRPPTRREDAAVLGRVQALRCAPALRAPAAAWTRPARGSHGALIVGGRSRARRTATAASGVPR